MPSPRLRVYYGPDASSTPMADDDSSAFDNRVTVPAAEILELLADAIRTRRSWLVDFLDEEMTISSDLHEVLLAYQHYRRPSA